MATWKALLGAAGGGDFVSADAFYYYNSRLNVVPNSGMRTVCGDADGNFYHLTFRRGGSEPEYNNQNLNEYSVNLFDKDANYQSTSYVWRSDISSSNSFYDSNGMNIFPNSDGTGFVTNGFMEASYISSYYPMYVGNWSRSNFTTGPDSQFAISRTYAYYQLAAKDNLRIDSNGNNIILHRANMAGNMRTVVTKFNSDYSSVAWAKYFEDGVNNNRYFDIDDNDNIYIGIENDNYAKNAITKLNSSGVVQWSKQYGQWTSNEIDGIAYNAATDEVVIVARGRYINGNSDTSIVIYAVDASNGTFSWGNAVRPYAQSRSLYGVSPTVDELGNIYVGFRGYGLYSPGGYRSSWGAGGVFSVEGDGTMRYANAFDPDGKDSTGGQDYQGFEVKSCAYDKYTDTVLISGEGNPNNTSRGSWAARVPADGSLTSTSVEYAMGNSGYSVCYYSYSTNGSTSGHLEYASYTPSTYTWSNPPYFGHDDPTKTTLSLSDGNINDSSYMKIAGPIT